eukprot:jgi/Bigna1/139978/aug1.53_g14686
MHACPKGLECCAVPVRKSKALCSPIWHERYLRERKEGLTHTLDYDDYIRISAMKTSFVERSTTWINSNKVERLNQRKTLASSAMITSFVERNSKDLTVFVPTFVIKS